MATELTYRELFGSNGVDAESVEDFARRYRRFDRYEGRGTAYAEAVLQKHRDELAQYGITWISHYDSVTGKTVAWMPEERRA